MNVQKNEMNKPLFFIFCLLFCSCNFIDKKVPTKEELLEERLQEINWNEVTRYPSVSACDAITDKALQKACFFEHLTKSIQERLATDTLSVLYPDIDTINVKVTIHPDASLDFEPQYSKELSYPSQKIDSVIRLRLRDFPEIEPAQKEGIPVKTEFVIPIVLKVET